MTVSVRLDQDIAWCDVAFSHDALLSFTVLEIFY